MKPELPLVYIITLSNSSYPFLNYFTAQSSPINIQMPFGKNPFSHSKILQNPVFQMLPHLFFLFYLISLSKPHPCPSNTTATMYLPPGGKQLYTQYMQGDITAPEYLSEGSPIVATIANYDDGNFVQGGVLKSGDPVYNIIFMWAFMPNGTQYTEWPIDVSDVEDFEMETLEFQLNGCDYVLRIEERKSQGFLQL